MKIKNFTLFKNDNDNKYWDISLNEKVKTFSDYFHLNEENGGVANVTAGNTAGMGNVSTPPVSIDGSIYTYNGTGNPTETVGRGSGDIVAKADVFVKGEYKRKKKRNIKKEHFGAEQPKEKMYITLYTDWLKSDATNKNTTNKKN